MAGVECWWWVWGAGVVTTRNHVHYVVTEFGVASLYRKSVRERAQELIDVAHPKFRDELTRAARELQYVPWGVIMALEHRYGDLEP